MTSGECSLEMKDGIAYFMGTDTAPDLSRMQVNQEHIMEPIAHRRRKAEPPRPTLAELVQQAEDDVLHGADYYYEPVVPVSALRHLIKEKPGG